MHTYAHLNTPNSTLSYWYQLVFADKKGEEISFINKFLNLPLECKLEKTNITEQEFKDNLLEWFFENGELNSINLDMRRKNNEVNYFFKHLNSLIEIKEIIKIVEDPSNNTFYDLGIYYDYFFVNNDETSFMLMFRYTD